MSHTPQEEPGPEARRRPPRPRPAGGPRPAGSKRPRPPGAQRPGGSSGKRPGGTATTRPSDQTGSRPRVHAPELPAPLAAAATGMLVGVASVVLVALGMQACDLLRNSPSCGGPGLIMLIAIVVALIVLGRVLLGFMKVPDATPLAFLGVTIALVVVLAGFVEQTFSAWMWIVMPVLGAASFALCHLVLKQAAKPDAEA